MKNWLSKNFESYWIILLFPNGVLFLIFLELLAFQVETESFWKTELHSQFSS